MACACTVILNITSNQENYCNNIENSLQKNNIRAICDLRNEKISFKIREHTLSKIPYIIVIGDKEVADNKISVRSRSGVDMGQMTVENFMKMLDTHVIEKSLTI